MGAKLVATATVGTVVTVSICHWASVGWWLAGLGSIHSLVVGAACDIVNTRISSAIQSCVPSSYKLS